MFAIANLENRTVLTTREGDMLRLVNEQLASNSAIHAQLLTNQPHAVVNLDEAPEAFQWLRRELAPWLVK